MEEEAEIRELLLLSRNYFNHLEECNKIWNRTCQIARENERDLLALSDQLRCLSMGNQTNLSDLELQKTSDRVILNIEEKFSTLLAAVECALKSQEELTNLRLSVENHDYQSTDIVQRIMKTIYVSWLLLQTRSSSVNAAVTTVDYKIMETIKLLLQCIFGTDSGKIELKDTLDNAEYSMSILESLL